MLSWVFACSYIQTHQIVHINIWSSLYINYTSIKLLKELIKEVDIRTINSKEKLYENVNFTFLIYLSSMSQLFRDDCCSQDCSDWTYREYLVGWEKWRFLQDAYENLVAGESKVLVIISFLRLL